MGKKSVLISVLGIIALVFTSCGTKKSTGGIVAGVVYADVNGNGSIEVGEDPLEGVDVILTSCGPDQTQTTGMNGQFRFINLPSGTCYVSISKGGWRFSGSYPAIGYPFPAISDPKLATSFSLYMTSEITIVPSPTPVLYTDTPFLSETSTGTPSPTPIPTFTFTPTALSPVITPISEDVNCRFGPDVTFSQVGSFKFGSTVPILGTILSHTWWQIENPQIPGTRCWVSTAVTQTYGDLSLVPIVAIPTGLVTNVEVSTDPVVHGFCGGPNPVFFTGYITTNGPVTVTFHWEIYQSGGALMNSTAPETLIFASASTESIYPGAYDRDCGSYIVKLIVTSPNSISGQANFKIVEP